MRRGRVTARISKRFALLAEQFVPKQQFLRIHAFHCCCAHFHLVELRVWAPSIATVASTFLCGHRRPRASITVKKKTPFKENVDAVKLFKSIVLVSDAT